MELSGFPETTDNLRGISLPAGLHYGIEINLRGISLPAGLHYGIEILVGFSVASAHNGNQCS
jgi:hypothetical protein